ncbi:MAG: CPBP family intramembrane glutamic endopeptidase [Bryobacteraceae bacterium]|jgi:membrane protease YdiL (CAAX protease family)
MPERLRRADFRFLAVCFLLLAGAVWFSARYFYRAFPEASIDFRVTRDQARAQAERFLASQDFHINGYRQASRFSYDDDAKTFLERELGLDRANGIMGSHVRLWRWSWRWFRPLQKEEFRVDVTPAGELAGFRHEIPEADARASLSVGEARAIAERFLRDTMHKDPATLDFVQGSSVSRPARTDHTFTWKERDFDIHAATYRLEVTVLGGEVGAYREYLKVPETWQRAYEGLRSRNLTAGTIDSGFMMLLALGLLVTIVLRVRGRDVRWRIAGTVGAIGALLYFLANWNAQPLAEFNYPTTDSYASFIAQELLRNLAGALGAGGLLFILTAGAEPLYRARYRARQPLGLMFSRRGLGSKQFFLGTILGITLAAVFVAYQTAFYMVAYRFGAWSPADVPYDDLLNTRLPWLFVLLGGFLPAVSEEFMFRMFAIPFLSKLLRYVPLAVVLAAFIWGFGHATYPQQPFWIRGVEVGIGGVALGMIMLRWGILPTLVWHYSVDAMYTALLLLRSHHPYFVFSGAASAGIMALPVVFAGIAYLRRGGFAPEPARAPDAAVEPLAPGPGPAALEPESPPYARWSARRRQAGLLVLGACAIVVALVHVDEFGGEPGFAIGPTRARAAAEQFARAQGFDAQGYRAVVFPATGWDDADTRLTAKYFVERRDIAYVAGAMHRQVPLHGWTVRFFKPLQREEARVTVNPEDGSVFEFEHIVPEDQPGAELSADAARDLVLRAQGLPSLAGFVLKESTTEQKKARRDYALEWEAAPGDAHNLADAHFRVRVTLAGDRIASFGSYWKLPETFARARERRNALSYLLLVLRIAVSASLLVLGIWLLIEHTRRGTLRWGRALWAALPLGAVALAGMAMTFPLLFSQYPTTFSLESFEATLGVGLFIGALALFIAIACGIAIVLALYPDALGVFRAANRKLCGVDAIFAASLAAVLAVALGRLRWLAIDRFHAQALLSADVRTAFATVSPAASGIASACQEALFWLALLAVAAHLVHYLRRWHGAAVLAGLVAAAGLVPGTVHTAGEFFLYFDIRLMYLAAAVLFVKYVARGNYLAYLLSAWTLALLDKGADLFAQPAAPLRWQGGILMAVQLATFWRAANPGRGRPLGGRAG